MPPRLDWSGRLAPILDAIEDSALARIRCLNVDCGEAAGHLPDAFTSSVRGSATRFLNSAIQGGQDKP